MPAMNDVSDLVVSLGLINAAGYVALLVHQAMPEPYMDEIFHVPQAQSYCAGQFDVWHDKITTPAGPYLVAWLISRIPHVDCSVTMLRAINVVAGLVSVLVVMELLQRLRWVPSKKTEKPGTPTPSTWTEAITIVLFPLHFFFWFLFYTDPMSTLLVLSAYLMVLRNQLWYSALLASASLLFRQTNIVWLVFTMASALLRRFERVDPKNAAFAPSDKLHGASLAGIWLRSKAFLCLCWQHTGVVIDVVTPYIPALVTFTAFVYYNNGVALGDRSNHVASLHVPQLYYFAAFTTLFSAPVLLAPAAVVAFVKAAAHQLSSPLRFMGWAIFTAINAWVVSHFTLEHSFLLSDNRHYTFYVWKNLYRRHPVLRYVYLPAYWFGGWHLWQALLQSQAVLWCVGFVAAVSLVLVPSPLLEFRYFIIPYMLLRTHIRPRSHGGILLELALYTIVNVATLWLFLKRPFFNASDPGVVQHFMW